LIECKGKNITLVELSEITGISYACLNARYKKGARDDNLIRPVEKHERLVEYKGENVALKELSQLTGIKYSTLVSRHFHKKELIK
jgi:predicted DNA-binding transcriptional regulator AlpA